ncbi:MAG: hypothetical protein V4702_00815 [Patescibacteria group bacterium]
MVDIARSECTRTHTYSRGAEIFRLAAESFGVTLPSEQLGEWQFLIKAAFTLDNILDSDMPLSEREKAFDEGVEALLYPLAEQWDDRKINRVVSAADRVKNIAAEKREAVSARLLGKLAVHEGEETARFLQLDNPAGSNADDFNTWLKYLLRFGVPIDTAVDLREDYGHNLTQVTPTRLNSAVIASFAMPWARQLLTRTPSRLYRPLFAAARAVTQDTAKDTVLQSTP